MLHSERFAMALQGSSIFMLSFTWCLCGGFSMVYNGDFFNIPV